MRREPVVNAPGDQAHLRQMLQHQSLATQYALVVQREIRLCRTGRHCLLCHRLQCLGQFTYQKRGDPVLVAGSISSGITCPVEKNERGLPVRTASQTIVPVESVSSSRVNSSFAG